MHTLNCRRKMLNEWPYCHCGIWCQDVHVVTRRVGHICGTVYRAVPLMSLPYQIEQGPTNIHRPCKHFKVSKRLKQ